MVNRALHELAMTRLGLHVAQKNLEKVHAIAIEQGVENISQYRIEPSPEKAEDGKFGSAVMD